MEWLSLSSENESTRRASKATATKRGLDMAAVRTVRGDNNLVTSTLHLLDLRDTEYLHTLYALLRKTPQVAAFYVSVLVFPETANYLLVITWFPAAVVVHERYLKNCIGWCTPQHLAAKASSMVRGKKETEEEIETEGHFMEVFFGGPFAHFIVKFGKAIVFVFALLLIGSTVCWTLYLKPASKTL